MANPEHLVILEQDIDEWNIWRKENQDIRPDLSGAGLIRADLIRANLNDTDLSRADLIGAELNGASLIEANLIGANLIGANLINVDFNRANLCDADLSYAYIRGANFRGANLHSAILSSTVIVATDLSETKSLDKSKHNGPSYIDQTTLVRSGKLPEVFLRGCGLSDEFIQYIPSLFWNPELFQFYSCFISYSSKDEEFATRLYADLQTQGVRCWFALEDMKTGDKIRQRIDESIRVYDKLLLILSENSINSSWVEKEVESAFEKEQQSKPPVLFPIRLDNGVMDTDTSWAADIRRTRHIGDFTNWKDHDSYQAAFKRLLRDLRGDGKRGK